MTRLDENLAGGEIDSLSLCLGEIAQRYGYRAAVTEIGTGGRGSQHYR